MNRLLTLLIVAVTIIGLNLNAIPANTVHAAVIKPCNQSTYDPKAPYTTYTDYKGKVWRCARNYVGRYVWYYATLPQESDPVCDENRVGVDNDHIWQNSNGEYFKCELQANGIYKWVPIRNPFLKSADLSATSPRAIRTGPNAKWSWSPPACETIGSDKCIVSGYKFIVDTETTIGTSTYTEILHQNQREKNLNNIANSPTNIEIRARIVALYDYNSIESDPVTFEDLYLGSTSRYGETCAYGNKLYNCNVEVTKYLNGSSLLGLAAWDDGPSSTFGNVYCQAPFITGTRWNCGSIAPPDTNGYYDGLGSIDATWSKPGCENWSTLTCKILGYYVKVGSRDTDSYVYAPGDTTSLPTSTLPPSTFSATINLNANPTMGTNINVHAIAIIETDPNYYLNGRLNPDGTYSHGYTKGFGQWSTSSDIFAG